jgi:hypothetical protein
MPQGTKTNSKGSFCLKTEQQRRDELKNQHRKYLYDTAARGNPPIDNNVVRGYN